MSQDPSTLPLQSTAEEDKKTDSDAIVASVHEEAEVFHASLKANSIAQIVIAFAAIVGLLYFLRYVFVTGLCALLAAFILEPMVGKFTRIGIPRAAGAFVAVLIAFIVAGALSYFLFIQIDPISRALPQYSGRITQTLSQIREPISRFERSTRTMASSPGSVNEPEPILVQEAPSTARFLTSTFGTIGEFLFALSFLPCLTYFMLTWKDHAHAATVMLFPEEHRPVAYRTAAKISGMIRSFLIGNLVVWLISAVSCTILFWYLGLPFFYVIGVVCGFLSLIPSIGAILAVIPPIVSGIGALHLSGFLIVVIGVFAIHAVTLNVLYPKLVGRRVLLNPLAVILSLLIWAWIWGAMGLILAIPIVAAVKIVCDHTDSLKGFGTWLGI
jgi:predicted PurR-regulated permease PerM